MNTQEIWKSVRGYESFYKVSNLGRVMALPNHRHPKPIILKPQINGKAGYYLVFLQHKGISKGFLVHRLVAEAFIPNPDGYKEVNHRDENKANNSADNLEWCSRKYNVNYGNRNARITGRKGYKVFQYTKDMVFIRSYPSTRAVERELGYCQPFISKCCRGKVKDAYGYIWSYTPLK